MDTGLHTRTGLRVRVSRARVRVSKLLSIGKPAPVTRGCGFGRRSFKKLVIDIFFSVFIVNDNNASTATPSLANVSRGGFYILSTKVFQGRFTLYNAWCRFSRRRTFFP